MRFTNSSLIATTCTIRYAINFSLPPLMKTLGYSNAEAYLIPVPIFFAACAFTIANSWWSDRRESR